MGTSSRQWFLIYSKHLEFGIHPIGHHKHCLCFLLHMSHCNFLCPLSANLCLNSVVKILSRSYLVSFPYSPSSFLGFYILVFWYFALAFLFCNSLLSSLLFQWHATRYQPAEQIKSLRKIQLDVEVKENVADHSFFYLPWCHFQNLTSSRIRLCILFITTPVRNTGAWA